MSRRTELSVPNAAGALTGLVYLLFFASGALALVYQVSWSRLMTHVFGSTAVAVGVVLAAFMGGMALGSWRIGLAADRSRNCLALWGWLELGIGGSALVTHWALTGLPNLYPVLHDWFGGSALLLGLGRFAIALLLVMAPTALMGATLPVLSRLLVERPGATGRRVGALYAANTLGAVLGVLLTGFLLIGRYGIHWPVLGAAIGNALIGVAALLVARAVPGDGREPEQDPATAGESASAAHADADADTGTRAGAGAGTVRLVLLAIGFSGVTSFAYEIYWTRSLVFVLGNSTYALSTMLAAFLTGIGLGSLAARRAIARCRDLVAVFGWVQVGIGVTSALALPLLFSVGDPQDLAQRLLGLADGAVPLVLSALGLSFLVMLIPAALIGATLPLASHLAAGSSAGTGAAVGRVYAINTVGNVLGALLPGLVLLAWLGIQRGILLMAAVNLLMGFGLLALRLLRRERHRAWRVALPAAIALCVLLLTRAPLDFQFPSNGEEPGAQTLYYREGPLGSTKVFFNPGSGERHMSVDGIVIGGTGNVSYKQKLLAHLPRLLLDEVPGELSVGLGSGILAGESARHRDLEALTVVEIEPSVIEGAELFAAENHRILEDPRLELVADDIASFLRTDRERYALITADEKTADEYASNGFSYSLEYYELLRDQLAPGGLVAQWVPATLPPRQFRMILRTFTEAFPHAQLWYFLPARRLGPFNAILIGSRAPVPVRLEELQARFERRGEALAALAPYGLTSAAAVAPHFVADERTIRAAVADAPLNTLAHPRYEFYHPWDYARDQMRKIAENHGFIVDLKRQAHPDYFAALGGDDRVRLRDTFVAEFRYLEAFGQFLGGLSLTDHYRLFDEVLALAPWNDSLRARIYSQYRYLADSQRDPAMRARLRQRAEDLYPQAAKQ